MRAYTFGPFVLFPDRFVLVRNGVAQQLTPRLLSVLHYLIKHRNRVVTKEELLAEVWRGTFIEEGIVGRTVSTLRALLGDVAERPIYIQTVSRVGYRFVHSVNIQYPDAAGEGFVGRANEIAFLHDCLARCEQGSSSIVCVSGAAGIGKTALCERLLSDVEGRAEVLRSRCAPHLSTTESYGPFIDAFAHRISIPVPPKTANLDRRFAAAVTEASRKRPLVLFIDDFHWADRASADLIGFLSLHLAAVRMLLIVTLRPTEILRLRHPFGPIHQELQVKGACHSLPLNLLSLDEMAQYLDIAAPVSDGKEKLLHAVYKHSEGNPLFMISALRHLKTSGALCQSGGKWRVNPDLEQMELTIPPNISGFLVHSIEQLDSADQVLLRIASIQGVRFDSATLSDVSGMPPIEVEERLRTLARVHELIQYSGETSINGGPHTDHYRFIHRLFWKTFQDSVVHSRRIELASKITESRAKRVGDGM